jgi:hypothetical protein
MGNLLIVQNAVGINPAVNEVKAGKGKLVEEVGDH